jgi:hypothetical protein
MEFAARFWFGSAKTAKNLYAPPSFSNAFVSRLTYSGLQTYSIFVQGSIIFGVYPDADLGPPHSNF